MLTREQLIEKLVELKREISIFCSEVDFDDWLLKAIKSLSSEISGTIVHLSRLQERIETAGYSDLFLEKSIRKVEQLVVSRSTDVSMGYDTYLCGDLEVFVLLTGEKDDPNYLVLRDCRKDPRAITLSHLKELQAILVQIEKDYKETYDF